MHSYTLDEMYVVISGTGSGSLGAWPTCDVAPINASYCSHKLPSHGGIACFDPIYFGVYWAIGAYDEIEHALTTKRALGITDVCIAIAGGYGDYLSGATFDFRGDPLKLRSLAGYLLDRGFRPLIYVCTADGGTEKEIYNGTMQRVCEALVDLVDHAWFSIGWEVDRDRGGAFTAGQASDALLLCRRVLGEKARLVWHGQPNRTTPASYWGSDYHHKPTPGNQPEIGLRWVGDAEKNDGAWIDEDDPSNGSEQGAFYVEGSGFAEIDVVFYQTDHGTAGPSYINSNPGLDDFSQPMWWGRALECLDRFLASGTPMPGASGYMRTDDHGTLHIHPGVAGARDSAGYAPPDWFAEHRRRGRVVWVLFETVCYEYIRGGCSDAAVQRCTREARSFGCQQHGCAQPAA